MIDAQTRARRIASLRDQMASSGVELTAIAPTDNLRYLLGFSPKGDERACMLLVSADAAAVVMPSLHADQTASEAPELELIRWSDDAGPSAALATALDMTEAAPANVAVDPEMLRRPSVAAAERAAIGRHGQCDQGDRPAAGGKGRDRARGAATRGQRRRHGDAGGVLRCARVRPSWRSQRSSRRRSAPTAARSSSGSSAADLTARSLTITPVPGHCRPETQS